MSDTDTVEFYMEKLGYNKQLKLFNFNTEDSKQLTNSIVNSYNGDEFDENAIARYSFYDNLFYKRLLILAWFSYIFLFIYYTIKINNNINIIRNKLLFFFGLFIISQILFTIVYCMIHYIWFNVYNNDSINNDSGVTKWKNIKSNDDKVMLYVRRNVLSSIFITTVIFDPFLSRWIKMLSFNLENNN